MTEFVVLRCPSCKRVRLCPADRFDEPGELKPVASEHLRSHRLTESKHGIFRVTMVRRLDRVDVDESAEAPQQWTDEPVSVPG